MVQLIQFLLLFLLSMVRFHTREALKLFPKTEEIKLEPEKRVRTIKNTWRNFKMQQLKLCG